MSLAAEMQEVKKDGPGRGCPAGVRGNIDKNHPAVPEACASRGVIVHHEPVMRSKHTSTDEPSGNSGSGSGGGKGKNRNRGKGSGNSGNNAGNKETERPRQLEVAKVVTPERAVEINSVVAKIAASTVAAHEAAGEHSPIVLTPVADKAAEPSQATEKLLESVLDALPEPKAPGQGRRIPRRVTSGGVVSPETATNQE